MSGLYDRQTNLGVSTDLTIAVVGCGGVGTWVALLAAMAGVKRLMLFDSDVVDGTNLNRLPYTEKAVGKPKTQMAAALVHSLRPECIVTCHEAIEDGDSKTLTYLREVAYVLIDCCDHIAIQPLLATHSSYIKAGCDGSLATVLHYSPAAWGEQRDGYTVQSWVGVVAFVAALAVMKALWNWDIEFNEDLLKWRKRER